MNGSWRLIRFSFVGVVNTVVHYLVYLVLWLFLPYLVANALAICAAMLVSYFLHCRFTFAVGPTARNFSLFPLVNLTNVVFSTVAVFVFVELFGLYSRFAALFGGVAAMPFTFLVSRKVFADQNFSPETFTRPEFPR